MHVSSYAAMEGFVERYLTERRGLPTRILDLGSQDVNGTYRPLFDDPLWEYVGADSAQGSNVDVVLTDPYDWRELEAGSFDVVVTGQTLEHVERPWATIREMRRIMRPGAVCCVIAPSAGPEHRYPLDCWRILSDGMRSLAHDAGLEVLEVSTWSEETDRSGAPNVWRDSVLIARKADTPPVRRRLEEGAYIALRDVLELMQEAVMERTRYFGVPTLKAPVDAWVYQELLYRLRPRWIVEIGTGCGGSALMLAHLCDLLGSGQVISIDRTHEHVADIARSHERITLVESDACDAYPLVRTLVGDARAIVIEDSSHTFENTLAVLRTYSSLVPVGGYIVVEDTICGHGLDVGPLPGPYEAVETFLQECDAFTADRDMENFFITWSPKGYLRRDR